MLTLIGFICFHNTYINLSVKIKLLFKIYPNKFILIQIKSIQPAGRHLNFFNFTLCLLFFLLCFLQHQWSRIFIFGFLWWGNLLLRLIFRTTRRINQINLGLLLSFFVYSIPLGFLQLVFSFFFNSVEFLFLQVLKSPNVLKPFVKT